MIEAASRTTRRRIQNRLKTSAQRMDHLLMLESEATEDLREQGVDETTASKLARIVVLGQCRRHGPGNIYFPAQPKAERDAAIKAKFNGTNAAEVMHEFNISRSRLYEIAGKR